MASQRMLDLARRGAEVRLRELAHEARHLLDVFPHLADSFDPDELPVQFILEEGARTVGPTPPRGSGMSAAARRAASRRMKKYWSERRKTM